MTEYLKKETILEFQGEIVPFPVPEMGGNLPLRAVGFSGLMEIQKVPDDVERALAFIRLGIVDPDTGEPMFGEEEFLAVANRWSVPTFKSLAEKLKELSGTDDTTRAEIEGNSEETTKGGSPIS